MDSLDWRKKYEVLSISRWYLRSLGFTSEQITSLSNEDMHRIADTWNNQHFIEFEEDMKFIVSLELAEKEPPHMIDWSKQFAVAFVTRNDLIKAGISAKLVENLNDEAMEQLAKAIGYVYGDHDYWEDFDECVESILFLTLRIESPEGEAE